MGIGAIIAATLAETKDYLHWNGNSLYLTAHPCNIGRPTHPTRG